MRHPSPAARRSPTGAKTRGREGGLPAGNCEATGITGNIDAKGSLPPRPFLKVAYISSMRQGLPAFTYREIKEMMRLGTEVHLFIMRNGSGLFTPDTGWTVYRVRPRRTVVKAFLRFLRQPVTAGALAFRAVRLRGLPHLVVALDFASQIRRRKIELIYCNEGLHALWIGHFCKELTGISLSVIVHSEMVRPHNTRRALTGRALSLCDEVVTVSRYNKRLILEQYGVPKHRVHVVRLFVDSDKFKNDDRIKILIVARFSLVKGHATLLRALKRMERDDVVVWIVGGEAWGGEGFDVRRFVEELGLRDSVIFFGPLPEPAIQVLYQNSDIFCLPSRTPESGRQEGLPVVLMEAMAYAKPVIATYHGGIPELVPEVLIEEDDDLALARHLARLCDDPSLRTRMGRRNRRIVQKEYSKRNVQRLLEVLSRAARGRCEAPQGSPEENQFINENQKATETRPVRELEHTGRPSTA